MNPLPPTETFATTGENEASLSSAIQEGMRIVIDEQERGEVSPLARWLASNPDEAGELGRFMAGEREVRANVVAIRASTPSGTIGGRYVCQEEIGRGGMGVVYRAFHLTLKQDVALKLLLTGPVVSADERSRFRTEVEIIASLSHPNIVSVFDSGEENGTPYLVMPIMERSLAAWLKVLGPDRCLSNEKAAELVRDIALGVHHAHQRLILHRDLKPGNILLDRENRPHVADFGLARPLDESISGGVAGTAAYMAPEQARGEKHLTTAVDIHALGAILFELLTGGPPFGTGTLVSVQRRVIEEPAPLVRTLRKEISRDLEYICRKCLEKHAPDRYASAQALADDLTRVLQGESIVGQGSGLWKFMWRAVNHRRETSQMATWPIAFWGSAWSVFAVGAIQASVLLTGRAWVHHVALAGYFIGWFAIIWMFYVRQRESLNTVERGSLAIHIGMFLATASMSVTQLWMHDGDVLTIFPPLTALMGLALFAYGVTYWGRLYLIGAMALLVSAALPLIPKVFWPGTYGLTVAACQAWAGIQMRHYHCQARAAAERWRCDVTPPAA